MMLKIKKNSYPFDPLITAKFSLVGFPPNLSKILEHDLQKYQFKSRSIENNFDLHTRNLVI